jgi:hypothetical protein
MLASRDLMRAAARTLTQSELYRRRYLLAVVGRRAGRGRQPWRRGRAAEESLQPAFPGRCVQWRRQRWRRQGWHRRQRWKQWQWHCRGAVPVPWSEVVLVDALMAWFLAFAISPTFGVALATHCHITIATSKEPAATPDGEHAPIARAPKMAARAFHPLWPAGNRLARATNHSSNAGITRCCLRPSFRKYAASECKRDEHDNGSNTLLTCTARERERCERDYGGNREAGRHASPFAPHRTGGRARSSH